MKSLVFACFGTLATLGLVSCQSKPPASAASDSPAATPVSSVAPGLDSAEFAYQLSQKTWCTNDEACCLLLHMVDGQDRCQNFQERLELLKSKNLVQDGWRLQADRPVTKGTLAYMVCRSLDIPGGLMMNVLPCRRYAYREAVYRNLMVRGAETEPLTGPEVVGILGRAARYGDKNH